MFIPVSLVTNQYTNGSTASDAAPPTIAPAAAAETPSAPVIAPTAPVAPAALAAPVPKTPVVAANPAPTPAPVPAATAAGATYCSEIVFLFSSSVFEESYSIINFILCNASSGL